MAWFNGGVWLGEPLGLSVAPYGLVANAMRELVNACNERVQVLRQMTGRGSAGTYYEAAGAGPANHFPSLADMQGLVLGTLRTDGIGSHVAGNLQDCIGDMAEFFLKSHTTSPAAYTLYANEADLLGDGSYGAAWLDPTRLPVTDMWLQMREALENLIWPTGAIVTTTGTRRVRSSAGSGFATMQDAWDSALVGAIASQPAAFCWAVANTIVPPDPYGVTAWIDYSRTATFSLPSPVLADTALFYPHKRWQSPAVLERAITLNDNQGNSSVFPQEVWPVSATQTLQAVTPALSGAQTFTITPNDLLTQPWVAPTGAAKILRFAVGDLFLHTGDLASLMTYG